MSYDEELAIAYRRIDDLERAITDVWPHLTGHCHEGATPECFGTMRDTLSAAVPGLPYA